MRLNKYTLKIENGNKCILYNVITKIMIEIDCRSDEIQEKFISKLSNEEIKFYKDRLLISEDNNDDYIEMKKIKNEYNNQSEIGRFLIHLGYQCNLKCSYCYQSTIAHERKIKRINIDKVIEFIINVTSECKFEILEICFIGGEPMLYYKEILKISNKINSSLLKQNIYYSVVTNGTMLDEKHRISNLIKNNVKEFQVTVDGIKGFHDKFRNDGINGSFDKIMKNLENLITQHPDLVLSINYNLSKENYDNVNEFLLYLREKNINVNVFFSMIFDNGKNFSLEWHHHNTVWKNAHLIAMKHGQIYSPFYRDVYLGCALTQKNYFIIGADEKIYKCINAIDNKEYCIGDITEYGSNKYNERLKEFLSYEPENLGCQECELYPVCFGGCEYRNRINGFRCEKKLIYENEISIIREIANA